MSWDCPEGATRQGNVQIAQVENEQEEYDDPVCSRGRRSLTDEENFVETKKRIT